VLLSRYLVALAVTLAVEVPLYTLALHALYRLPWRTGVVAGVLVNLVTHPALWFGLRPWRGHPGYPRLVLIVEAGAGLIEWLLLRGILRWRRGAGGPDAVLLAVVVVSVNAASVLAGLALPG
jgi:hypothetical protein